MVGTVVRVLALAAFATKFAAAAPAPALVTVLVPFGALTFPISATIAGVNSLGQTTYIISEGEVVSSTPEALTVTLVEGSDYMSYTVDVSSVGNVGAACGLIDKNGTAVCTEAADGKTATVTNTFTGSWVLDVASTAAPGGSTSAPAPTQTANSSQGTAASTLGVLLGLALAYYLA
ncbi:hypothetical protein FB451DRAFT_1404843 [Mycena latifolia]|nr:hypothetical protein FB451DRAFT_1404843 [Mycena latifolia]